MARISSDSDGPYKPVFDEHPELFHYTTGHGLAGILGSKTLWATDIQHLNDFQEQHLFYDQVLPEIALIPLSRAVEKLKHRPKFKQLIKEEGPLGLRKRIFDATLSEFKSIALTMHRHFVLSFSSPGDDKNVQQHGLLSQWRAYGGDSSYAIVFDESLHSVFSEELTGYRGESALLGDVQYHGVIGKDALLKSEFQRSIESVKRGLGEMYDHRNLSEDQNFFISLTHLACFSKHWGFSEEREVRLLVSLLGTGLPEHLVADDQRPSRRVLSRTINGASAPYIEIFGSPRPPIQLPIKRIIVGPSSDQNKAFEFAKITAGVAGYGAVPIAKSEIPYRPPQG